MKSSPDPQSMTIGQLGQRFGLRAHVLRHWETMGLLAPAGRVNGRRRYTAEHLGRVAMIVQAKAAGLTLEQVRAVLAAGDRGRRRALLLEHHDRLERRIAEIEASKLLIEHALDCDAEDFTQCPRFLRIAELTDSAAGPPAAPVAAVAAPPFPGAGGGQGIRRGPGPSRPSTSAGLE